VPKLSLPCFASRSTWAPDGRASLPQNRVDAVIAAAGILTQKTNPICRCSGNRAADPCHGEDCLCRDVKRAVLAERAGCRGLRRSRLLVVLSRAKAIGGLSAER
jgi:hypothetical protein